MKSFRTTEQVMHRVTTVFLKVNLLAIINKITKNSQLAWVNISYHWPEIRTTDLPITQQKC